MTGSMRLQTQARAKPLGVSIRRSTRPIASAETERQLVRTAAILLVLVIDIAVVLLVTGIGAAPGAGGPAPMPGRLAPPAPAAVVRAIIPGA